MVKPNPEARVIPSWFGFLVWPVALLVIVAMFRDPLSDLIRRATRVEVVTDTKSLKIAIVAANLAAAETSRTGTPVNIEGVAAAATRASASLTLAQARVLWVDDNPNNNRYERSALEALGVQFDIATGTDEALKLLSGAKFSLVISDFDRRDDQKAGYTLLDQMAKLPSSPPVIIYSSSADPQHEKDAKAHGALGQTNSPQRLFDLVIAALVGK